MPNPTANNICYITFIFTLSKNPQRPHPRSQSFIFVRLGCLYVYGGYDGHSVLADMYKLDLATRTWSLIWASKFSYGCGGSPVGVGGLRPVDFRIHPCRPAAVIGTTYIFKERGYLDSRYSTRKFHFSQTFLKYF